MILVNEWIVRAFIDNQGDPKNENVVLYNQVVIYKFGLIILFYNPPYYISLFWGFGDRLHERESIGLK